MTKYEKENPIPIPQRFAVTLEEAGYLMGVSAQTISKYIKAGSVSYTHLRRSIVI